MLLATAAIAQTVGPVTIPDILEVRDVSDLALSPDGTQIAFRTEQASAADNGWRITWYVAPIDGSTPARPVADGGSALPDSFGGFPYEPPLWSPASNALYFRALVDGQIQVWRAAADGSGSRAVTDDLANVRDLTLSADGRALVYHAGATRSAILNAERAAKDGGVLIDASVDMNQPLTDGGFVDGRLGSQRVTGPWFDRVNILWQAPFRTETVALVEPDRVSTQAIDEEAKGKLAKSSAIELEAGHYLATVTQSGRKIRCSASICRSERPVAIVPFGRADSYILTLSDVALNQTLALWKPTDQSIRIVAAVHGLLSGGRRSDEPCAVASDALVCVAASAAEPPKLVRVGVRDGQLDTVFDPNADLRQRTAGKDQEMRWQDKSGQQFAGQLFLPKTAKPAAGFPLVISYYRCEGFLRGGHGDELPLMPLATDGVATLCINEARHSSATQTPEADYSRALSGMARIIDIMAADEKIDRSRVGYWGLSFGSEVAFRAVIHTNMLAAVSVGSGSVDPMAWWMNSVSGRSYADVIQKFWNAGDPDVDRKGWRRISLALNVKWITTPILLQAPEQEARFSMELLTDATRAHRPVEMWGFAAEPHVKVQPRHKLAIYVRNEDWFRYWLQNYQDPVAEKEDQYKRWAVLRRERNALTMAPRPAHP